MLFIISLLPGPVIYLLYKYFWHFKGVRLGLTANNKDLTILLATYSFSMLGFLATIITVVIALGDKLYLKTYRNRHHMDEMLILYFIAILDLFACFIISVLNLGKNIYPIIFDVMIILFCNSLFQITLIGIIIGNLLLHAFRETAD